GTVELSSCRNVGTTLRLKIPLTLAIIPALLVRVGDQSFAIPQVKLVELLRVNRNEDNQVQIEIIHDRPILRLRGRLLPLLDLSRILNPESKSGINLLKRETINIVVLNAEKRVFGLVVESVEDSIDIVVKPLASFLKDLGVYNGATLLGDGSIALTLDVNGLADHENLILRPQQDAYQKTIDDNLESTEEESTDYLLVDAWSASPCAIPLCVVHRLEEFSLSQIRCCGQQRVIKYRDSLLPLISVREMLGWDQFKGHSPELIAVVVVKKIDRMFGLEVRSILDVIQSREVIDTKVRDQRGIVGSFIMGHEVVTVLDSLSMIDMYLEKNQQIPEHFPSTQDLVLSDHRSARARHHLLLVEDSSFFRNHVQRVLSDAGYHVTATINGQKALQVLDKKDKGSIAAIVSDIEMPVMGGLDFAREVRSRQSWGGIPMIALSSRYSKADVKKGLESGFSRYIEKMNPDELIREVDGILGIRKGA
ncbi:MAG: chemotaxis protein CheW, partial [Oligoflexus sp.]